MIYTLSHFTSLAFLPGDAATSWSVVLALLVLANLALAGVNLNRRNHVQKREITLAEEYVPMELWKSGQCEAGRRLDRLESELSRVNDSIRTMQSELERSAEVRASKIHDRVNALSERLTAQLGELAGRMSANPPQG
jgi:hypothetical protein